MKTLAPFTLVMLFASAASAQDPTTLEEPPNEAPRPAEAPKAPEPPPPRFDVLRVNAGAKVGYVTSDGFDTFATNNALAQFSVDATYPLLASGRLVLAAGLGWDVGGRSDSVRGLSSSLTAHRLTVPVEARWSYVPGLSTFLKLAPGAAAMLASVSDGARTLETTGWAFAADASAGAAILVVGSRKSFDRRNVRLWITPEAGYAFTTSARLGVNPGRPDDQVLGSDEDTGLRSLALSGAFWRLSLSATY